MVPLLFLLLLQRLAGTVAQTLAFTVQPTGTVTVGVAFSVTVTKSQASGGSVYLTLLDSASNTLALLGDMPNSGTSYVFTGLVVASACSTCKLQAISGGFTAALSTAFNAQVGSAASLVFSQTPTSGAITDVCSSTNAIVQAMDPTGLYVDTSFTGSVTLSLAGGVGTMAAVSANAVAGVATFANCVIAGTGTFYLYASSGALIGGTSSSFTVSNSALGSISFSPASASGNIGTAISLSATCYDSNSAQMTCTEVATLSATGPGSLTASSATISGAIYAVSATFSASGSYTLQLVCPTCGAATLGTASITIAATGTVLIDFNSPIQQGHSNQSYRISVTPAPTSSVTITISSQDSAKLQVLTAITISAGDTSWQTVTVNAPVYPTGSSTYTVQITHTLASSDANFNGVATFSGCINDASGTVTLPIYNYSASTVDFDSAIIVIQGNSATITVTLGNPPTTSFTVTPGWATAVPAEVTFTPASRTFTNVAWGSQTFTVSVSQPVTPLAPTTYTLNMAFTGDATFLGGVFRPSTKSSSVTVIETSSAGYSFSGNVLINKSTGTGTYSVRLLTKPSSNVVVAVTTTASELTISAGSSLTFTPANYNTSQAVSLIYTIGAGPYYVDKGLVMTHTATSSDSLYNNLVGSYTVEVLNICYPAVFVWPPTNTCSKCPAGFDCTTATAPTPCALGSYQDGTATTCTPCTANNYCPSATAVGSACQTGYFSSASAIECTRTATGKYSSNTQTCAAGTYATGAATAACASCIMGHKCLSQHRRIEVPCSYGTMQNLVGKASCNSCTAGNFCNVVSGTASTGCGTGTFSLANAYACSTCPSHMICVIGSGPSELCGEGSTRAQGTAIGPCSAVAAGSIASISSPGVVSQCPYGTYISGNNCVLCPAGKQCDGSSTQTDCVVGTYSTGGVKACTECPPGYFQTAAGSSTCSICTAGKSCTGSVETACTAGNYAYAGAMDCLSCAPGSICAASSIGPMSVLCTVGNYCQSNTAGAVTTNSCPPGTYGNGLIGASGQFHACFDCPPGFSCTGVNKAACTAGYYCPARTSAVSQFPCPAGTFSTASAKSIADCQECPAGKSCAAGSASGTTCGAGNFCPAHTMSVNNHVCPMGTKTGPAPTGSNRTSSSECLVCPIGVYCPVQTAITFLCPQGTYNPNTGAGYLQNCLPCTQGKVCPSGNMSAASVVCKAGFYCPKGVYTPIPCPAGTFTLDADTALTSLDECQECPIGKACGLGTTTSTQVACTAGYYCPLGTAYPTQYPCPSGTFSAASKSALSDCAPCTAQFACPTGTGTPAVCTAGYYCPASTDYTVQYPCPAGTYSLSTTLSASTQCTDCPLGKYCPEASTAPIDCPAGMYADALKTKYLGPGITDSCKICVAGNFCGVATQTTGTPCLAGTYSTAGLSVCLTCPAGYFCPAGSSDVTKVVCPGGSICPAGSSSAGACVAGKYCPQGTQAAIPCPPGTYGTATNLALITDCTTTPAGYYTNTPGSTDYLTNVCTAGYYCPAGSTFATVISCPPGTFRATTGAGTSADCTQCTAGKFCRFEATVTPESCYAGYYCLGGSVTPTPCPKGTYRTGTDGIDLAACKNCDAGSYCDEAGATAVKGSCKAGFLCKSAATTSTPTDGVTGELCPAGGYCTAGTPTETMCTAGYYNDLVGSETASDCKPCVQGHYCDGVITNAPTGLCTAGSYCPTGSSSATQNPAHAGSYAPAGSIIDVPCLPGTFTGTTGQATCSSCTAGYFCQTSGTSVPTLCLTGYYCPAGSIVSTPCPPGTYHDNAALIVTQSSECKACSGGNFCKTPGLSAVTGQCSAGYYCTSDALYYQPVTEVVGKYGPCPVGKYCVLGTTTPVDCLAGTYNPAQGGAAATDCLPCPAGYFCSSSSMSSVGAAELCPAGYFCGQGQSLGTTNPCPVGYICPAGSMTKIMCEAGTYANVVQSTACTQCPAGSFCPPGTGDYSANICPAGYYCPAGTEYDTQYPCPVGKFNPDTGKVDSSACQTCTAGSYCNVMGLAAPTDQCSVGFYCSAGSVTARPAAGASYGGRCTIGFICPAGATVKTACPAGKYCSGDELGTHSGTCYEGYVCLAGATVPAPTDGVKGYICPIGSYCVAGGTAQQCSAGTFLPYTGGAAASECLPCVPGYVCPNPGMDTPTAANLCPAGYICASGVAVASVTCPPGSMCPQGSAYSIKCPVGSYQDAGAQSTCKTCNTAGTYCVEGSVTPTTCEAGYFCPLDISSVTSRQPCPVGTFNSASGGTTSAVCVPCTAGKYCGTVALSAVTSDCSGGYYCSGGAISSTPLDAAQGGMCSKGYYCPVGSSAPVNCDPGFYCGKAALSAVSGPCMAGYYCTLRAKSPNPTDGTTGNVCPTGNFCPPQSSTFTPCLQGTYSPATGLAASSECLPCPFGYYCATAGLSTPTGQCSAGYYCSSGSISATSVICPAGAYCPVGSFQPLPCLMGSYQDLTGQSSCKPCEAGKYCTGGIALPLDCPVGHYCPASTRFGQEFPCPDGKYAGTTGLSVCSDCTAGFVCNTAATTATVQCPANKYCPLGSSYGLFCPLGSYNTATLGLAASTACSACPTGSYCVDGTVSAQCEAGYYCVSGSVSPTPPSSSSSSNGPCSSGYYCTKGALTPTICPPGMVNPLPGGAQVSACTTCPPGYYCVANNPQPIPCPAGNFCPQGAQKPTPCRVHTYNPSTLAVSESSCTVCPAGFLCTDVGIVTFDLPKYRCPAGYYSVQGGATPIPCPPGTFGNSTALGSYDACTTCSGGQQCPGNATVVEYGCPEGTYCPIGSAMPLPCPVGFYCFTNSTIPTICPAGYFCPKYVLPNIFNYTRANLTTDLCALSINPLAVHLNNTSPFKCPLYSICPEGSYEPQYCAPGQYVEENLCRTCNNGTYSKVAQEKCLNCDGGYICLAGATRPNPTSIEVYKGYICPSGFYCPSGFKSPMPCPVGTYNPVLGKADNSSCLLCPADSYNDQVGRNRCIPCGSSSKSVPGSTICTCLGANRAFQKTDGTCRCIPGYEFTQEGFTLSVEDSTLDCFPKVFTMCTPDQIRGPNGDCKGSNDCVNECGEAGGSVLAGVGVCQCNNVRNLDDVCNKGCREKAPVVTIDSSGNYVVRNTTTNRTMALNLLNQTGYYGAIMPGSSGRVYSIDMQAAGPKAQYSLGSAFAAFNTSNITLGRRLQNESPEGILNPVACLHRGDSFIFSIPDSQHFPVYNKDSLLNTNPDFDYGPFLELKRMITSASTNVSVFAFSFNYSGIFDFSDNANPDAHIIVSVIGNGQTCPDSDLPLKTRTQASVLTLGTATDTGIIEDPDWGLIGGSIAGLIAIMSLLIGGLYVFFTKEWKHTEPTPTTYRTKQQAADLTALRLTHPEPAEEGSEGKDPKDSKEVKGYDDIDPSIFQSMHDRLIEYHKRLAEGFEAQSQEARSALAKVLEHLERLRALLEERLGGLNPMLIKEEEPKDDGKPVTEPDKPPTVNSPVGIFDALVEKYAGEKEGEREERTDELRERVQSDPNLSAQDKERLLGDLEAELQRIQQLAEKDKSKSNELLQQRLLERKRRRGRQPSVDFQQAASSPRTETPHSTDRQSDLQKIEEERVAAMDEGVAQLRQTHDQRLAQVASQEEADQLMRDFEREMKALEERTAEQAALKRKQLEQRLAGRQKGKVVPLHLPEPVSEELVAAASVGLQADPQQLTALEQRHEEEKQRLLLKQDQEIQLLNTELESSDPERIRARLAHCDNEAERRRLMAQLKAAEDALKASEEGQQHRLEDRLKARQQRKGQRKAALQQHHEEELNSLVERQMDEEDQLKSDLELQQLMAMVKSKEGSPEQLAALVRKLLDDKHDQELANLAARKQAAVVDRQLQTLQTHVQLKAERLADLRVEARRSGASPQEEKEAEAQAESDYLTNLRRDMDSALGRIEDEYRRKLMELTDRQMSELEEVLRCIRALDPAALQRHLTAAQQELAGLKGQAERQYDVRKQELEEDLQAREVALREEEARTKEVEREVEERRKRLEDVALQRKRLEERQRELREKLKQQGISQEAEEAMLSKHQQELEAWDRAIEEEMARQRAMMEKKRAARQEKQQARKAQVVKEEQAHEDQPRLTLLKRAGVAERLIEPFHDLESKLRVDPLPRVSHYVVEAEGPENVLDSLLQKVKRIESLVENVDAQQFTSAIEALENLHKLLIASRR